MDSPKPVIFFDWDGTLAHSLPLCILHLQQTLAEMGYPPLPESTLARCNGPTYEEAMPILGIAPGDEARYMTLRREWELRMVTKEQRLFPGIRPMLEALGERFQLAIVSNGLAEYLDLSMAATGVTDFFTWVEPYQTGRPKPQALRSLMDRVGPCRGVMVGDRQGDILAGQANGLPTIAACYGYGSPDEWALADQQAYSVDMLQQLLLGQGGLRPPWNLPPKGQ